MSGAPALLLARAGAADLPFVMQTERTEGFEHLVGRWDENRHREALADGRHAYFVGRAGGEPVGFAIVRDWGSPERVSSVKRIVVAAPGRGAGSALLRLVVGAVFGQTDTHRLWLGVFPENSRARRAYEAVGFMPEGVARGSAFFGGVHRDELILSILRPEWSGAP